MQHGVPAGADGHGERVGDGVVDREELQSPRADGEFVAFAHPAQVRLDAVLVELGRDQSERQPRPEDRDVLALAQQVGQRADVVLVPVGEHDRVDLVESVGVVGPVGQRDVDAR